MNQDPARPDSADGPHWEAVARHLSGESTAAESAAVRRQLDASPADAAFVAALERATQKEAGVGDVDVETALKRIRGRLDEPDVQPLRPREFGWRDGAGRWGIAAAAAAVLMVGGLLLRGDRAPVADVSQTAMSLTTGVGERDSLRLSDGSLVVLGPVSSLEVTPGYGDGRREVTLKGEGYFEVQHDDSKPFVVHAGDAAIHDIGTRFVVRVGRESATRVAVTEGAVSVKSARASADTGILLQAGDVGTLMPDGRTFAERGVASESDVAWTRGTLVFRDAAMTEVSDALRRWYGVAILVDSALARRHLTATFSNEPIDRVLEIIALTLGARVDQQGDTAVVRPAAGTTRR